MGQLVFQATAGGQVALVGPNPSTNFSLNVPAVNGNLVTTGDTGTVTNTMLASSAYTAPGTIGSGTPNTGKFTSITNTGLTATQVIYATTGGLETSSANMTFDGTKLTLANDASISGLTVGKGGGGVSSNTVVGNGALAANSTQGDIVAVGYLAAAALTGNNQTTVVGSNAFKSSTLANGDAFGYQALTANTTGSNNSAFAYRALYSNTTGASNSAFGNGALYSNTTASNNTAVGYQAGYNNTTGTYNIFIGHQSGYTSSPSGSNGYNTIMGAYAGYYLTTGYSNTFIGTSQSTGFGAGAYVTTGSKNTIIGGYNGNQGGLDIRTASNYIVLSDGDGNPRGIFDNSGNFLVGTTSAAAGSTNTVYYAGSSNWTFRVESGYSSPAGLLLKYSSASPNNTGNQFLYCQDGGNTQRMSVASNGGIYNYSANNSNLSDIREKKNIELSSNYLDKICAIPVKTFLYNDQTDKDLNLGVIAQDVQAVAPELVMESNWANKDEPEKMRLSIYQTDLQYALMKAIQELNAKVTALEAQLGAK